MRKYSEEDIMKAEANGDYSRALAMVLSNSPPLPKPFRQPSSLVYFIEGGGLIKIGVAASPEERLRHLQNGSPCPLRLLATMPGGHQQENKLHQLFAHCHSHGEWFRATTELRQYIESIPR